MPKNPRHTKKASKRRSLKQKRGFGRNANFASKKVRTKKAARQTRSAQTSQDTIPSTQQTSSPTAENAKLVLNSHKESVTVQREDLRATISLTLSIDGDDTKWLLTGTFNDLETAIRFVSEAWTWVWLLSHARTPLRHAGLNRSSTLNLWRENQATARKDGRKTPSRNLLQ